MVRYLEHIGARATPANLALVEQYVPIGQCAVRGRYSTGVGPDFISVDNTAAAFPEPRGTAGLTGTEVFTMASGVLTAREFKVAKAESLSWRFGTPVTHTTPVDIQGQPMTPPTARELAQRYDRWFDSQLRPGRGGKRPAAAAGAAGAGAGDDEESLAVDAAATAREERLAEARAKAAELRQALTSGLETGRRRDRAKEAGAEQDADLDQMDRLERSRALEALVGSYLMTNTMHPSQIDKDPSAPPGEAPPTGIHVHLSDVRFVLEKWCTQMPFRLVSSRPSQEDIDFVLYDVRSRRTIRLVALLIKLLYYLLLHPRLQTSGQGSEEPPAVKPEEAVRFDKLYAEIQDLWTEQLDRVLTRNDTVTLLPLVLFAVRVSVQEVFARIYPKWAQSRDAQGVFHAMDTFIRELFDPSDYNAPLVRQFEHMLRSSKTLEDTRKKVGGGAQTETRGSQARFYTVSPLIQSLFSNAESVRARHFIRSSTSKNSISERYSTRGKKGRVAGQGGLLFGEEGSQQEDGGGGGASSSLHLQHGGGGGGGGGGSGGGGGEDRDRYDEAVASAEARAQMIEKLRRVGQDTARVGVMDALSANKSDFLSGKERAALYDIAAHKLNRDKDWADETAERGIREVKSVRPFMRKSFAAPHIAGRAGALDPDLLSSDDDEDDEDDEDDGKGGARQQRPQRQPSRPALKGKQPAAGKGKVENEGENEDKPQFAYDPIEPELQAKWDRLRRTLLGSVDQLSLSTSGRPRSRVGDPAEDRKRRLPMSMSLPYNAPPVVVRSPRPPSAAKVKPKPAASKVAGPLAQAAKPLASTTYGITISLSGSRLELDAPAPPPLPPLPGKPAPGSITRSSSSEYNDTSKEDLVHLKEEVEALNKIKNAQATPTKSVKILAPPPVPPMFPATPAAPAAPSSPAFANPNLPRPSNVLSEMAAKPKRTVSELALPKSPAPHNRKKSLAFDETHHHFASRHTVFVPTADDELEQRRKSRAAGSVTSQQQQQQSQIDIKKKLAVVAQEGVLVKMIE
jgi:hypothetical protein